jgi:hypothetical protein
MANHLPSLSAVILHDGTVFRYGILTLPWIRRFTDNFPCRETGRERVNDKDMIVRGLTLSKTHGVNQMRNEEM